MDIKEELKAIIDIELKPEFELAINEVIDKSYKDDIEKLGPDMASLVRSQWEQMRPYLFFAYCLGAKAQAVPEGYVLVKKANRIGNPNVDFSQAPGWAKYWLKDGHSNKYWWSSTRPIKDMDLQAFCWRGDYFAEEAPSFNFAGSWDKSLTSKKAVIEAQEPTND